MSISFPALVARTHGFTLGSPRRFTVTPDGSRVLFVRSRGGEDPVGLLWSYEVATATERLLVDVTALGAATAGPLTERERARRERARDRSAGIGSYATDAAGHTAVFTVAGRLYAVDVASAQVTDLGAREPAAEARIDPTGRTVAYVCDAELRVVGRDGADDRPLAEPDGPEVTWGLPEHEAAESMDRFEGYWWAPHGRSLVAARVDNTPVQVWYVADPASPQRPPTALRYPSAGTPNADVSLHVLGLDGSRTPVEWDRAAYEYVTRVVWDATGLLVVVQNRRQTTMRVLTVDPVTVDGVPVTPPGLQLEELLSVDGETVLFAGRREPTERHLWTWSPAGGTALVTEAAGVHAGRRAGGVTVVDARTPHGETVTVDGRELRSLAAEPAVRPMPRLMALGERELRTAVLFPTGHVPGSARLPVLMDPYGGSAGQKAVAARSPYWAAQWFADQGFAVIVADGRGTPGRGPRWERARGDDHAGPRLQDQVDALHAAAERFADLDLERVAIRGWSAGGYLAALAVLRRPDVFHAAAAGAPVTDQLLYSTHWQERTLGLPAENPEGYARGSLLADAPGLRRPLLLIHGMLDDNVLPVHTMKLSAALLAAGRPHTVLPLPGATHMGTGAHNLWEFELSFLRTALKLD